MPNLALYHGYIYPENFVFESTEYYGYQIENGMLSEMDSTIYYSSGGNTRFTYLKWGEGLTDGESELKTDCEVDNIECTKIFINGSKYLNEENVLLNPFHKGEWEKHEIYLLDNEHIAILIKTLIPNIANTYSYLSSDPTTIQQIWRDTTAMAEPIICEFDSVKPGYKFLYWGREVNGAFEILSYNSKLSIQVEDADDDYIIYPIFEKIDSPYDNISSLTFDNLDLKDIRRSINKNYSSSTETDPIKFVEELFEGEGETEGESIHYLHGFNFNLDEITSIEDVLTPPYKLSSFKSYIPSPRGNVIQTRESFSWNYYDQNYFGLNYFNFDFEPSGYYFTGTDSFSAIGEEAWTQLKSDDLCSFNADSNTILYTTSTNPAYFYPVRFFKEIEENNTYYKNMPDGTLTETTDNYGRNIKAVKIGPYLITQKIDITQTITGIDLSIDVYIYYAPTNTYYYNIHALYTEEINGVFYSGLFPGNYEPEEGDWDILSQNNMNNIINYITDIYGGNIQIINHNTYQSININNYASLFKTSKQKKHPVSTKNYTVNVQVFRTTVLGTIMTLENATVILQNYDAFLSETTNANGEATFTNVLSEPQDESKILRDVIVQYEFEESMITNTNSLYFIHDNSTIDLKIILAI